MIAQPINDDCDGAIELLDVANWCSPKAAYTSINATPSGFGSATCFDGAGNDVWFRLTTIGSDLTILVRGNDSAAPGGTMTSPQVALYAGDCSGSISQLACKKALGGQNVVSLHKGGLGLGAEYLIRVQGGGVSTGTFELCVTNFNPPAEPGQDCVTAANLCDKSTFTVQKSNGGGNVPNEAAGTCLDIFGNTESSSTWLTWTAATTGSLTFTLSPTNEPDDLDFVVYEIPNGNCAQKIDLLCNAAGDSYPSICMGPTGLNTTSTDVSEGSGCFGGNDGWLRPLDMVAGKQYALLVNNYSNSGSGFTIDFGGAGAFKGPEVNFSSNQVDDKACLGDNFTFTDESTYPEGTIALWEWSFGVGSTPVSASTKGPHTVSYKSLGTKLVSLKITSAEGCEVTYVKQIEVLPCCETVNAMLIDTSVTNLGCYYKSDAAIDVNVTTNATPVSYVWDNGHSTSEVSGLALGFYNVTITNAATCDTTFLVEITAPPKMEFDTLITQPTCNGGQDGVLEINSTGGVPPYEYNFENAGFTANNTSPNLPIGAYSVVIRDSKGCTETLTDINVQELELLLNSNVLQVDTPSCFGFSDGRITLGVLNGLPPYQYDFGSGFTANNVLANIPSGNYTAMVQDANLCKGNYQFSISDHPAMTMVLTEGDASCFGLSDGSAFANVGGGVGHYAYRWSNQINSDENLDIPAGIYVITATDGNGCEKIDSIEVNEPAEINIYTTGTQDVVCFGDETGVVGVYAQGGSEPYLFSFDGGAFQQDTVFLNVMGGGHRIAVQDSKGCINQDSAFVPQPEELIVHAFGDTTVLLGFKINLSSFVLPQGRPVSYQWYPGDEFSFDTIPNPILQPKNTAYYYVQVVDSNDCKAIDSVLVQVRLDKPVYAPNAFSPNGDGINDFFTLFGGPAAVNIQEFRVYDRWGDMVFSSGDLSLGQESVGWDGTYRGKKLETGIFIWEALVDFWDGKPVLLSGEVALIR